MHDAHLQVAFARDVALNVTNSTQTTKQQISQNFIIDSSISTLLMTLIGTLSCLMYSHTDYLLLLLCRIVLIMFLYAILTFQMAFDLFNMHQPNSNRLIDYKMTQIT